MEVTRSLGANQIRGAVEVAGAVQDSEGVKVGFGLHEIGENAEARRRGRGCYQGRREMAEITFRKEAGNVAYADHETRVFHDVVLVGPAQLRTILEALKAERTRINTCREGRDGGVRGSRNTRVHVHHQG